MAIVYQVFSNGGSGGPVDYTSPVATTSATSWTSGALAASSDTRYAVRALDTTTGLAESNTQASVRITLDATGIDVTAAPNAPFAVTARPTAGGGCAVAWAYRASGQAAAPSGFLVYLAAGPTAVLGTPAATVAYQAGVSGYACTLAGLADATVYTVSVVAAGPTAASSPPSSAQVRGDSTAPLDVESLAAIALP